MAGAAFEFNGGEVWERLTPASRPASRTAAARATAAIISGQRATRFQHRGLYMNEPREDRQAHPRTKGETPRSMVRLPRLQAENRELSGGVA